MKAKRKITDRQEQWLADIAKRFKVELHLTTENIRLSSAEKTENKLGSYEDADMPEFIGGKWVDQETGLEITPPKNPYAPKTYL